MSRFSEVMVSLVDMLFDRKVLSLAALLHVKKLNEASSFWICEVSNCDNKGINLLTNESNLASPLKWTTMVHFMMKTVRSISSLYKNSFTLWVGVLCDELFKCELIFAYLSSQRGRRSFSTTGTQARIRLTIFWSTAKEGSTRLGKNKRQQHQQLSLTSNLAPGEQVNTVPKTIPKIVLKTVPKNPSKSAAKKLKK